MTAHNTVISTVVCLLIAAKLIARHKQLPGRSG